MSTDTITLTDLVGHKADELWVSNDGEHTLAVVCAEGVFLLGTEGDCCSESWWADAIGVKQLLEGGVVTAAEEIDMPDPGDDRTRQDSDVAYGIRLTTDRGVCDLIFRNSSNGYYGGSAWFRWEPGLPQVSDWDDEGRERVVLESGWRQITADWSA